MRRYVALLTWWSVIILAYWLGFNSHRHEWGVSQSLIVPSLLSPGNESIPDIQEQSTSFLEKFAASSLTHDPTTPCDVEKGWKFYSQSREDVAIHNFFCNKTRGVFVELGALDGIRYSNTKFLEDHRRWTGLLIEAQPDNAVALKKNRPKSMTVSSGVCKEGIKNLVFTGGAGAVAGDVETMSKSFRKKWHKENSAEYTVPCRPIGHLLREAGISHVDLFSLDVEGAELKVLETMDWSISVTLWVVELDGHDKQKDEAVRTLLASHGYMKSKWDIRSFCCSGCDCTVNETFELRNGTR